MLKLKFIHCCELIFIIFFVFTLSFEAVAQMRGGGPGGNRSGFNNRSSSGSVRELSKGSKKGTGTQQQSKPENLQKPAEGSQQQDKGNRDESVQKESNERRDDLDDNRHDRYEERLDRIDDRYEERKDFRDDVYEDRKDFREDVYDDWRAYRYRQALTYSAFHARYRTPTTVVVGTTSYYQCGNTWYTQTSSQGEVTYVVVSAPSGAELTKIDNPKTITANGKTYYVSNHTYYERIQRNGKDVYVVVDPPLLVEVSDIPEGAVKILVNGKTYYQYDKVFYEEVSIPEKTIYKIVEAPY